MRSSKSRSRNKNNRNRPSGNIVNRVFDSSGPEGKVRGTPQQIIDKYNQLARDAQLSNDRVATENFQQHAEHYLRMLAEAQREQAERQAQQQAQQQQRRQQQQEEAQNNNDGGNANAPEQPAQEAPAPKLGGDVIDVAGEADTGLVETPEERPQRQRRPRRKPQAQEEQPAPAEAPTPDAAE